MTPMLSRPKFKKLPCCCGQYDMTGLEEGFVSNDTMHETIGGDHFCGPVYKHDLRDMGKEIERLEGELAAAKQEAALFHGNSDAWAGAMNWDSFIKEYTAWAVETFPSGTAVTASKHLQREAKELTDSQQPEEVADCLMLIMFVAHRMGIDLLAEARQKFEVNKLRQWNKPDSDGIAEHVRAPTPSPDAGEEAK